MLLVLLTGEIVAFEVADGPGERVELKISPRSPCPDWDEITAVLYHRASQGSEIGLCIDIVHFDHCNNQ